MVFEAKTVIPIAIFCGGCFFNVVLEKVKSKHQLSHSIIEKRANIYAEIQEDLNNIYSYIKRVGKWKDLTPEQIIECKRKVDQKIYSTKPYWSKEMFKSYNGFMKTCFETNRGHAQNAGIIAEIDKYKEKELWSSDFEAYFSKNDYDEGQLDWANNKLMDALSKDFGVDV